MAYIWQTDTAYCLKQLRTKNFCHIQGAAAALVRKLAWQSYEIEEGMNCKNHKVKEPHPKKFEVWQKKKVEELEKANSAVARAKNGNAIGRWKNCV